MEGNFVITLELHHMKQTITQGLFHHMDGTKKAIEQALQHEIESFDFSAEVARHANAAIQKAVQDSVNTFFAHGEGKKAIDEAINPLLRAGVLAAIQGIEDLPEGTS